MSRQFPRTSTFDRFLPERQIFSMGEVLWCLDLVEGFLQCSTPQVLVGNVHNQLLGGSVNCIVAPLFSFGIAQSVPPWASMIVRLIDSPRPMPPAFVVKNGLKIRSISFGSNP